MRPDFDETQESVYDWCEEFYPGESEQQKFKNLLEEVVELGCVRGIFLEEMLEVVRLTVAKSDDPVGDPDCTRKEIGDVELSIKNLAHTLGIDTQAALNEVMALNRQRTLEQTSERVAKKREFDL